MKNIFVLLVLASAVLSEGTSEYSAERCEKPKVYRDCATNCPSTCDEPGPRRCNKACNRDVHCVCPKPYVQISEKDTTCVRLSECPERCHANEVFSQCPSSCQPNCDDRNPICTKECGEPTCVCKKGYIRKSRRDHECIKESKCSERCEKPKVYRDCATNCPSTCDQPRPRKCNRACNRDVHCVCPEPYVQISEKDSTCVRLSECPKRCDENEVFSQCPSSCQPTCDNKNPICIAVARCDKPACVCKKGYIRKSNRDKKCIKESECSERCEKPKVYRDCATNCPSTCDEPGPRRCNRACNRDVHCVCPKPYVQISEKDSTCVRLSKCPAIEKPIECIVSEWKAESDCILLYDGWLVKKYTRRVIKHGQRKCRKKLVRYSKCY